MWLLNPYWYTRQYSAPVSDYLDRVIAADVAAGNLLGLEDATKTAYATFIDNLIVDGYLGVTGGTISQASSVIKASPIMAGARTLAGALVPLVGTAPTNVNFVAGDYNRKTGLVGNGTTKYLDSNRNNNADPRDSKHLAVFTTAFHTRDITRAVIGMGTGIAGESHLLTAEGPSRVFFRNNFTDATINLLSSATSTGLWGSSRAGSTGYTGRFGGSSSFYADASSLPTAGSITIFARSAANYSNARLAFYSIGESLDLALLDARVTALINAFAAAIP